MISASDGSGATFVSRFTAAGASHLLHCLLLKKAGLSFLKKVFLKKFLLIFLTLRKSSQSFRIFLNIMA